MSSRTESQTFLYRTVDWLIGRENLVQFREDFKWIVYNNLEKFQRWDRNPSYLQSEALAAKDHAQSSYWDRIGFVIGAITSMSIFFPIPFNIPLTILAFSIMVLTAFRRVCVMMLLFDDPYRIYHQRQLKFACAWNRAMDGWTSLFIIPMGILNSITPERYNLGLWALENAIKDEYE